MSGTSRYAGHGGGGAAVLELPAQNYRTLCNLRIGLPLLFFSVCQYRKMQRS